MKVILDMVPMIKAICSEQKISENTAYRLTKLCVSAECGDGTLLFHTLNGMLVLLEGEEDLDDCRDKLIRNRFLVPADHDEFAYADKVINIVRAMKIGGGSVSNKEKNTFTVLTTTDCNARCDYCYEIGINRCSMSFDTANKVSDHIIKKSVGKSVDLRWFGGEPLVNTAAIDVICTRLRESGIEYSSKMISNGYCLDQSVIKKAVNLWDLKVIQIAVDGVGEVYNRVKAYVNNDKDAYSRVMQNIKNALDAGIEVCIRMNVSGKNTDELLRLADDILMRFPDRKGLSVNTSLIGDFKGRSERFNGDIHDADSFLKLREKLMIAGLNGRYTELKRDLSVNGCMADNDSCEVILPDGRLCKCDVLLEKDCYGSVYTEERDQNDLDSWKEYIKLPQCCECPLYPRCINLKKCPWVGDKCSQTNRKIRITSLQLQITEAYNKLKERSL